MLTGCVVNSVASNDRNNGNALFADLPRGTWFDLIWVKKHDVGEGRAIQLDFRKVVFLVEPECFRSNWFAKTNRLCLRE